MNFLNDDFAESTGREADTNAAAFRSFYLSTHPSHPASVSNAGALEHTSYSESEPGRGGTLGTLFWNTIVLSERTALNYSRNLLAYGVRAGMYAGSISYLFPDFHIYILIGMGLMLA
jgi:hypothetical protein